jgi:2,4-dienoyl-CoA reductase (NADPH2)
MNPDVTIMAVRPSLATPQIPRADRPNVISGAELRQWRLLNSLLERGVTTLTEAKCREITADGLVITTKEGRRQTIEADTVVFAEGIEPNPGLFQAIEGKLSPVYLAGDCQRIGLIKGAIADGARTALSI